MVRSLKIFLLRTRLGKLATGLVIAFALLMFAETALRVFGFSPKNRIPIDIPRFEDEKAFFRNAFDGQMAPNPKPRIFCLGDSFTYGMGVPADQTYPAQLEEFFGGEISVFNYGSLGSGPVDQEQSNLDILRFSPDLVILGALINDALDAQRQRRLPRRIPESISRFQSRMADSTALYPFLLTSIFRIRGVPLMYERKSMSSEDINRGKFAHYHSTLETNLWIDEVFPIWRRMHGMTHNRRAQFLLVVFPVAVQFLKTPGIPVDRIFGLQKLIVDFADQEGIPVIDLAPFFQRELTEGRLRLQYTPDETNQFKHSLFEKAPPALFLVDGHPSPAGYKITAKTLRNVIKIEPDNRLSIRIDPKIK